MSVQLYSYRQSNCYGWRKGTSWDKALQNNREIRPLALAGNKLFFGGHNVSHESVGG